MNFKQNTIEINIKLDDTILSSGSGLIFNSDECSYLLSSKHSLCFNFNSCDEKECGTCEAEIKKESISSSSIAITIKTVHQSRFKDIALAVIDLNLKLEPVIIKNHNSNNHEYSCWKGGTEDRLILDSPETTDSDVRLNIKSNINAHDESKNDEVSGFSGSPVHIEIEGKKYLIGVLTDSSGINDVSCIILDNDLTSELENNLGKKIFYRLQEKDILDKSMNVEVNNISSPAIQNNALQLLIANSQQMAKDDPSYRDMIEEFQEFLTPRAGRKIIGLDDKLIEGNREDLLDDAIYLESRFSRKVSKVQMSDKEQIVYFHCLSKINSYFNSYVRTKIKANKENDIIDASIQEKIINPLYKEIAVVQPMSMEMIRGMLYFLTGKCHIRWK